MRADLLHSRFFSCVAGKENALIASLRIFMDQSQDLFHADVVHTRKAFVKEEGRYGSLVEQFDQRHSQTDVRKVARAGAQTAGIAHHGAVGERECEIRV